MDRDTRRISCHRQGYCKFCRSLEQVSADREHEQHIQILLAALIDMFGVDPKPDLADIEEDAEDANGHVVVC